MTVVISSVNLKGGVGKTAIAVNLAAYCGKRGLKTLLIDLDPQTNATFSCISPEQWSQHAKEKGSVANLLGVRNHTNAEGQKIGAKDVLYGEVMPGVDLIPSHLDLFTVDLDIAGKTAREKLLKKALADIKDEYDIIICDCPPNLTLPTQNALAVSTHYLVPVSLDFLSSLGIALLIRRVNGFAEDLEVPIELAGVVLSRVGRSSVFREQTAASLRQAFDGKVLDTEIKERSVVTEATAKSKSIFEMNNQDAKSEFSALCEEVLQKVGLQ